MSLTLKDETVEKLKIKWRILNISNGRIIKNVLDSGINLEIKMKFSDGVFNYFYVDLPNNVA